MSSSSAAAEGLLGLSRAFFGMQCFWGVESSFAKLSGVLRTQGFSFAILT
jgi:hypothetical protein